MTPPIERRKKMTKIIRDYSPNTVTEICEALTAFGYNADKADFLECFGNLGNHFWRKFQEYDHNIIKLWRSLDIPAQGKLANHLVKWFNRRYAD